MPRKIRAAHAVPTLVQERLTVWGRAIRHQRLRQKIRAADLCARLDVSDATLRRLERGDPGAGAALYLAALSVLGMLDIAAPPLPTMLWQDDSGRARVRRTAWDGEDADEYF